MEILLKKKKKKNAMQSGCVFDAFTTYVYDIFYIQIYYVSIFLIYEHIK